MLISDIVAQVISELPPDLTDKEDAIHAALFSGRTTEALEEAAQLDPWLSAHLGDLMEPLELIQLDTGDE